MRWIKYDECELSPVCERFAAQCRAMKDVQKSLTAKLPYSPPKLSVLGSIAELTRSGLYVPPGGRVMPARQAPIGNDLDEAPEKLARTGS